MFVSVCVSCVCVCTYVCVRANVSAHRVSVIHACAAGSTVYSYHQPLTSSPSIASPVGKEESEVNSRDHLRAHIRKQVLKDKSHTFTQTAG